MRWVTNVHTDGSVLVGDLDHDNPDRELITVYVPAEGYIAHAEAIRRFMAKRMAALTKTT
jgi:hypothetical protein